jgi:predicted short-subunit dehydrogenase-like oxidoreductase (DUF2520 family)
VTAGDAGAPLAGERLFILGAGRAGRGLARALRLCGAGVHLHGRRDEPGDDDVRGGTVPPALEGATVALLAVQDGAMDAALAELLAAGPAPGTVVLSASGSAEPARLDPARRAGMAAGTFHPLLPLSSPARAPALLRGAYVGVDGDAPALAAAARLAGALGAHTLRIPPGDRARYHAAAVFASNFPTVLAALAERLLTTSGVGAEAREATQSLMLAAVANLREQPPAAALTGPVARGDGETVRRHLAALETERGAREAYVALSRAALELVGSAGRDGVAAALAAATGSSSPSGRTP